MAIVLDEPVRHTDLEQKKIKYFLLKFLFPLNVRIWIDQYQHNHYNFKISKNVSFFRMTLQLKDVYLSNFVMSYHNFKLKYLCNTTFYFIDAIVKSL